MWSSVGTADEGTCDAYRACRDHGTKSNARAFLEQSWDRVGHFVGVPQGWHCAGYRTWPGKARSGRKTTVTGLETKARRLFCRRAPVSPQLDLLTEVVVTSFARAADGADVGLQGIEIIGLGVGGHFRGGVG